MLINITSIRRNEGGTAHYEMAEQFSPLRFGDELISFHSPVHVQLQVTNTGKSLFVQGEIDTGLLATCGRCLEEFTFPMHLDYEDEWVYSPEATDEQKDTALLFDKDEIEIGERILEQIVLALPMKFICSSDCQGLCPMCGTNLNMSKCNCRHEQIDPRLAALKNWHG